jgi:hypothetical protein
MSGLNQQFTKLSILNWIREFESRSLRRFEPACRQAGAAKYCGEKRANCFARVRDSKTFAL